MLLRMFVQVAEILLSMMGVYIMWLVFFLKSVAAIGICLGVKYRYEIV